MYSIPQTGYLATLSSFQIEKVQCFRILSLLTWRKPEALFVKTIAEMFGKKCEVLIHDFRNPQHSIMAIENGHVTGRKIGDPITDLALSVWKKNGYENKKTDRIVNYKTKK